MTAPGPAPDLVAAPRMRILLIEDEAKLADAVKRSLHAEGCDVVVAQSGEEGFFLASTETFDLVLLDLNLPGRDGLAILQGLRSQGMEGPVLILTARDSVKQRVEGLDAGANDYLTKPFAFSELYARARALTRRTPRRETRTLLRCGDLELDRMTRRAARAGCALELTAKEFGLLEYLLLHAGHVVTRDMLARDLWQQRARATPLDNVIDVHLARLRAKVDTPSGRPLIYTLRGLGFVLREAA